MDYRKNYEAWLSSEWIDEDTKKELRALTDEKEIEDRFHQSLEFGTAGLRGILEAGSNRMNKYTVGLATEAFARVIEKAGEEAKKRGVVIGYDVRHFSKEFSELAAGIFASHGIHVAIYKEIAPTPMVSFAIRELHAFAGVMMTASHNPREYNGYKAYGQDGSQILDDIADAVSGEMAKMKDFSEIQWMDFEEGMKSGMIDYISEDLIEDYYRRIVALSLHDDIDYGIRVAYTPFNGTGNIPVREVLRRKGYENIMVVPEQELPDPDFKTVGYPNPEDPKGFQMAEVFAKENDAELILGTDPDCDRAAIEVRDEKGEYVFLNGNKIGALLIHYILTSLKERGEIPENGVIVKSIVTGDLGKSIASKLGVETKESLTGFKNICGLANEYERTGEKTFLFGYEESIGYVYRDFVRDKDAVNSSFMIVEMAAYYKKRGKSLLDVLQELYEEQGYYFERVNSYVLKGLDGQERIKRMMVDFREIPLVSLGELTHDRTEDYLKGVGDIPKSNVLKFFFQDGSWYAIRPSGTEPKIKVYMSVVGKDEKDALEKIRLITEATEKKMDAVK